MCEHIGTKAWRVTTCFFKLLFLMHLALDVLRFFREGAKFLFPAFEATATVKLNNGLPVGMLGKH